MLMLEKHSCKSMLCNTQKGLVFILKSQIQDGETIMTQVKVYLLWVLQSFFVLKILEY